ncbi:transposase, partial [Staphylococcus schleiferi]|uniref:transposase n=1 Tax=Staphylococcus schleiferi TaxID=1295 RepID=UPI002480CAE2
PETQKIYNQRKIDVEPVFRFMKAILGFNRMSVRGINKVKREFGFVLMALNLRKLVASSAAKLMVKGKKSEIFRFLRKPRISSITKTILSQTLPTISQVFMFKISITKLARSI